MHARSLVFLLLSGLVVMRVSGSILGGASSTSVDDEYVQKAAGVSRKAFPFIFTTKVVVSGTKRLVVPER